MIASTISTSFENIFGLSIHVFILLIAHVTDE